MWCAADNYNYVCHICAKRFLYSNFNLAVIDKISNLHKIAPKIHIYKYHILKYNWKYRQTNRILMKTSVLDVPMLHQILLKKNAFKHISTDIEFIFSGQVCIWKKNKKPFTAIFKNISVINFPLLTLNCIRGVPWYPTFGFSTLAF